MALFLLMGVDHTHPDPDTDARGSYKQGDIVRVMDDTAHDGDLVKNPIMPPWYLIRVTGITKEQAMQYMEPYIDEANSTAKEKVFLRRRKFNIEVSNIPLVIRQELQNNRYVEVTFTQVRNYIRNRLTGGTV